mmetsp:Transcript_41677/g.67059  ORF Transcript_41677/g.67059 Transcript_41677/m.67059 type:complete len:269 (+) Transcript_41677:69-875(+)
MLRSRFASHGRSATNTTVVLCVLMAALLITISSVRDGSSSLGTMLSTTTPCKAAAPSHLTPRVFPTTRRQGFVVPPRAGPLARSSNVESKQQQQQHHDAGDHRRGGSEAISDRRSFLFSSAAILAGTGSGLFSDVRPAIAANGKFDSYQNVKEDIKALIKADMDKGPTLVRLAWHSSGTYDKMSRTGGSGLGTIRFKDELAHGANAGLNTAVEWLEPIHAKYNGGISYADLYTLAGITAIETLGGPQIGWRAGRVDAMDPSAVTPDGR